MPHAKLPGGRFQDVTTFEDARRHFLKVISEVDAQAVFASYSLYRIASADREDLGLPLPPALELAAWLLYPEFGKGSSLDPDLIQTAIDAIECCGVAAMRAHRVDDATVGGGTDELAVHMRLHSGMVRGTAYPQQVERRIREVLAPFETEFAQLCGIGPWRSLELAKRIGDQMEHNLTEMQTLVRDAYSKLEELARKQKTTSPAERAELLQGEVGFQKLLADTRTAWTVTFEEVQQRDGSLTVAEWSALRNCIGLTRENRETVHRLVDMQDLPIFFLEDDRAFLGHGVQAFDAIFTFFDRVARNELSLRNRYGSRVSDWMEHEIEQQMYRLFPGASIIRSARFPDPDHPSGETETDVIVCHGPFLIVIEAKGKGVDRRALRGDQTKLKRVLRANVQDAFYQGRRVIRLLERDGAITFKEASGKRVLRLLRDRLWRVMLISVTLEHLSGLPTQLAITQRLGLFKGSAYPWSVSIDDLDVITRFSHSPDVFLHYIERRTAHQVSEVSLHGDELDIFAQYLDTRLHPSIYEGRTDETGNPAFGGISFLGGEERFEAIYFAEWAQLPPPNSSVALDVPEGVRKLLEELRRRRDDGARWIAFALLSLNNAALTRLERAISDLRGLRVEPGRIVRVTAKEDGIVLNVMAHCGMNTREFRENAAIRSRMEHYRAKARGTVTFGIDQRSAKAFDVAFWIDGDCDQHDGMDKLLRYDRDLDRRVRMLRNAMPPGRNDLCPCGSGQKFKKCCLRSITFSRSET